ncbi:gluconolactonase [Paenibacillus paeoniae]|nr:gluconolactonase [Paenibacillus paeoniae]
MNQKVCLLMLALIIALSGLEAPAAQAAGAQDYMYSYWGESVPGPSAYVPSRTIDGRTLGVGPLSGPSDLVAADRIYILDAGNNRIVMANRDWSGVKVIDSFVRDGKPDHFRNPQGIFVTGQGMIYVADTENHRVVQLDKDGSFVRTIETPVSDVLRKGFEFFPVKVAVDKANRMYVVGRGVFDGLIEFDADGKFTKFTGANRVKVDVLDYFWKSLSTKAQRERLEQFIPVEFSNLDLDAEGFIYTTTSERGSLTPIKRLNPSGIDILRREGYYSPQGDLEYTYTSNGGSSIFMDIDVNEYGVYSALDIKRGRIFTYSDDGDLLYIFGKLGKQEGTFKVPVAIERLGEDIMVLDRDLNEITLFEPTLFGQRVNAAVQLYYEGREQESAQAWEDVLRLNANYEIAYIGIGKSLLRQEKNEEAMHYFKLGMTRSYHSKAFERHRKDVLRDHFGSVLSGISVLVLLIVFYRIVKRRRKARLDAHVHGTS